MPRKPKRKFGIKPRCDYDPENLENALKCVFEENFSFAQAAARFNVPKTTVYRKYRGQNGDTLGKPPVLNKNEEGVVVEAALVAASYGYPFTERCLKEFVQNYLNHKGVRVNCFKENLPGKDWIRGFLKRNKILKVRLSENMKRSRAELNENIINEYFDNLKSIENVPSSNIINYDETNLTDDPGKERVIVCRGIKHASRIMDFSKTSTSVMFAVVADGSVLPPYIVYKAKNLYPEWLEGGPNGTRYNRTKTGWFDAEVYEDWFLKIAFPYLKQLPGRKVIIGDNLASHMSVNVVKKCVEHQIEYIFLPPNSTHLCQPLDVSYFRPLKIAWRKVLTDWKRKHKGVIPKTIFPSLLAGTLKKLQITDVKNIQAGFKACGIFPQNRHVVLQKIYRKPNNDVNEIAMTESFSKIIEDATTTEECPKVKRSKRINVQPGRSVIVEDFDEGAVEEDVSLRDSECSDIDSSDTFDISQDHITIAITPSNIDKDTFVIVEFIYDIGSKKESTKRFVAKVFNVKKASFEVSCMRPCRGQYNCFVFPVVPDIISATLKQIKQILPAPQNKRGRFTFDCIVEL